MRPPPGQSTSLFHQHVGLKIWQPTRLARRRHGVSTESRRSAFIVSFPASLRILATGGIWVQETRTRLGRVIVVLARHPGPKPCPIRQCSLCIMIYDWLQSTTEPALHCHRENASILFSLNDTHSSNRQGSDRISDYGPIHCQKISCILPP